MNTAPPASTLPPPEPRTHCPLCGQANACALCAGQAAATCWCMAQRVSPEALARIPSAQRGQACLCADCAGTPPKADMICT